MAVSATELRMSQLLPYLQGDPFADGASIDPAILGDDVARIAKKDPTLSDGIDNKKELQKLLEMLNQSGGDLNGLPRPSFDNLGGMTSQDMLQALIDWIQSGGPDANKKTTQPAPIGNLTSPSNFRTQPASWNGNTGGGTSGGGGGGSGGGASAPVGGQAAPNTPSMASKEIPADAKAFLDKNKSKMTPQQQKLIENALSMVGSPYVYGGKADASNAHPNGLDCSGFANWATGRAGGQMNLATSTSSGGKPMDMNTALHTPGAMLIKPGGGAGGHIVISLGDGKHTIEAMGTQYGIVVGNVRSEFTYAVAPSGVPLNQV